MSFALYFFSGCSYDKQLGLAPLAFCPKSRNADADFNFFPNVTRSHDFTSSFFVSFHPEAACHGRNTATSLLIKNFIKIPFFIAVLGGVLPKKILLKDKK
jgi:hypothetical protein